MLIIKPRLSKPANSAPLNWLFVKSSRECGRDCCDFYYTHTRSHAIPSKPLYAWLWLYCATSFVSQLVGCNRESTKNGCAPLIIYIILYTRHRRVRHTCKLYFAPNPLQPASFLLLLERYQFPSLSTFIVLRAHADDATGASLLLTPMEMLLPIDGHKCKFMALHFDANVLCCQYFQRT